MKLIALTLIISSCQLNVAVPLKKKVSTNELKSNKSISVSINTEVFFTGPKKRRTKVYLC